ncbi:hypothetical protein [Acidaminococcus intestini]|uniref:hypothetical protein n=1 Tax=Acidaminococcus intestini TaxID=187327 RepID=UPI002674BF72|nr:hypothetical protein [Acidaminococcus intestini]
MSPKEYLYRIRNLKLEVEATKNELTELKASMDGVRAIDTTKDHVDGGKPVDMADVMGRIEAVKEKLTRQLSELMTERDKAREIIDSMPESKWVSYYRYVLKERYLLGKSWEMIAVDMSYGYRNVLYLHGKALQEFGKTFHRFSHS